MLTPDAARNPSRPAPPARTPLAVSAARVGTAAPSVLDRVLPAGDKQPVEVAAFQSSI